MRAGLVVGLKVWVHGLGNRHALSLAPDVTSTITNRRVGDAITGCAAWAGLQRAASPASRDYACGSARDRSTGCVPSITTSARSRVGSRS